MSVLLGTTLVLCVMGALLATRNFWPDGFCSFAWGSKKLGKIVTTRGSKAQCGWSMVTGSPFHCFMSSGILKALPLGARSQTTTLATPLLGPTSHTCSFLGSVFEHVSTSF